MSQQTGRRNRVMRHSLRRVERGLVSHSPRHHRKRKQHRQSAPCTQAADFSPGRDPHHAALVLLTAHRLSLFMLRQAWSLHHPGPWACCICLLYVGKPALASGIAGASRCKPLSFAEGSDAQTRESVASLLSFSLQHHNCTGDNAPGRRKMRLEYPIRIEFLIEDDRPYPDSWQPNPDRR